MLGQTGVLVQFSISLDLPESLLAWQAAQRLGPLATNQRPPFLCLVDECHRFCHLPQGMATALAQARGYGVGSCSPISTSRRFLIMGWRRRSTRTARPRSASRYRLPMRNAWRRTSSLVLTPMTFSISAPTRSPAVFCTRGGRARESAHERSAVEAAIRARYGRIEQPPPGRADADQPTQARSPIGFDDGLAGADEQVKDEGFGDFDGSPCVIPFDAPPNGVPLTPGIPRHDSDRGRSANSDYEQFLLRRGRSC
jgi:hypothetical protein